MPVCCARLRRPSASSPCRPERRLEGSPSVSASVRQGVHERDDAVAGPIHHRNCDDDSMRQSGRVPHGPGAGQQAPLGTHRLRRRAGVPTGQPHGRLLLIRHYRLPSRASSEWGRRTWSATRRFIVPRRGRARVGLGDGEPEQRRPPDPPFPTSPPTRLAKPSWPEPYPRTRGSRSAPTLLSRRWSRRLLHQSTQAAVASSTSATVRHGPCRWMSSVL